ncbi:protein of unknown function [Xenorhabdus nematophila AN6/1]|nr:protein of unknown function [Xenorhabdus nematophila AN6/1]
MHLLFHYGLPSVNSLLFTMICNLFFAVKSIIKLTFHFHS